MMLTKYASSVGRVSPTCGGDHRGYTDTRRSPRRLRATTTQGDTMKTLRLPAFGAPAQVPELVEVEPATPGPNQVAVAIEAAPINPSDLMLIAGDYGVRPQLPAALGAEGVGRIVAVGDGVD